MNGWYLPEDVARITGHTPRTIQRWCRERRIPHRRIGRLYRFTAADIEQIEQAYKVEPIEQIDVDALDALNPRYKPTVVVVPMQRPGSAA